MAHQIVSNSLIIRYGSSKRLDFFLALRPSAFLFFSRIKELANLFYSPRLIKPSGFLIRLGSSS
jgi:hypothetical protein